MESELYLTKALAKIMASKTPVEAFSLLEQILTDKEIQFVERRLRIGIMLRRGEPYTTIQKKLKVSAATVAVVADQLKKEEFAHLVAEMEKELARFAWLKQKMSK